MKLQALRALFNKLTGKKRQRTESEKAQIQKMADEIFGTDAEIAAIGRPNVLPMQKSKLNSMLPGRAQNISEQVLGKSRPGGLVAAGQAMARSDLAEDIAMGVLGGGIVGTGAYMLKDVPPEELGKMGAQIGLTFNEVMQKIQNTAQDATAVPQAYFMQMQQGFEEEKLKQQEMQNIQEFGDPMGAPVEVPPTIEEQAIQPVSLLMAQGGPAMSDNEPRFETRSPENQMFSIDTAIGNLMTEYDMVVRNKEFERAQMIADQIDQLQQQKIGIQSQNVPQQDDISRILDSISI